MVKAYFGVVVSKRISPPFTHQVTPFDGCSTLFGVTERERKPEEVFTKHQQPFRSVISNTIIVFISVVEQMC